jgi:hypothetical protein
MGRGLGKTCDKWRPWQPAQVLWRVSFEGINRRFWLAEGGGLVCIPSTRTGARAGGAVNLLTFDLHQRLIP